MKHLVSTALLIVLMMWAVPNVYSCACRIQSPQEAFEKSSAVFVGKFSGFTKKLVGQKRHTALRFTVERRWKGDLSANVVVSRWEIQGACNQNLNFVRGREYLIYANFRGGDFSLEEVCGRSAEATRAVKDFDYLNKLQPTQP